MNCTLCGTAGHKASRCKELSNGLKDGFFQGGNGGGGHSHDDDEDERLCIGMRPLPLPLAPTTAVKHTGQVNNKP